MRYVITWYAGVNFHLNIGKKTFDSGFNIIIFCLQCFNDMGVKLRRLIFIIWRYGCVTIEKSVRIALTGHLNDICLSWFVHLISLALISTGIHSRNWNSLLTRLCNILRSRLIEFAYRNIKVERKQNHLLKNHEKILFKIIKTCHIYLFKKWKIKHFLNMVFLYKTMIIPLVIRF